jgi:hypothetical protein
MIEKINPHHKERRTIRRGVREKEKQLEKVRRLINIPPLTFT